MKNKGFTLIELLAVILILGIIALIAIPTVSSVVEQSRKGAFENTVRNVAKAAETKCGMELLEGNGITNSYFIVDGVINHPLDIKGNLPDNATIYVSNLCEVRIYATTDKYFMTNDEEYIAGELNIEIEKDSNNNYETVDIENLPTYDTNYFDYSSNIHAQLEEVFGRNDSSSMYHASEYESKIISVSMVYGVPYLDGIISWDFSKKGDGSVIAWLEPNGENYDLYIGSKGTIKPTRTDAWFGHMENVETFRFDNIDTSSTTYFLYMFSGDAKVKELDVSMFNLKSAVGLVAAFNYMTSLEKFIIGSNFKGDNINSIGQTFRADKNLTELDLSVLVTTNKFRSIGYTFESCKKLVKLDISGLDFSKITNTAGAFNNNPLLQKVYVNNTWQGNVEEGKYYVTGVPAGENVFIKK